MKKQKMKTTLECLMDKNKECEAMKDALSVILMNTLNRSFNNDPMYKSGVLGNIEMALGKEEYERLVEYYK